MMLSLKNGREWFSVVRRRYRLDVVAGPLLWERRAELIAVALGILLVALLTLGFLANAIFGGVGAVAPSAGLLEVTALQEAGDLEAEQRAELLARPLFWQSRRPVVPPPTVAVTQKKPAAPKAEPLKGVELIGVFGSQEALGLIARVDGQVMRVSPGQTVKGWQMAGYDDGIARFTQGKQVRTLSLPLTTPSGSRQGSVAGGASASNPVDSAGGIGFGGSVVTKRKR